MRTRALISGWCYIQPALAVAERPHSEMKSPCCNRDRRSRRLPDHRSRHRRLPAHSGTLTHSCRAVALIAARIAPHGDLFPCETL